MAFSLNDVVWCKRCQANGETGLVWTQNRISQTTVPSYNNDRTVADGESGSEQLRHLVRNGGGEGDSLAAHGIADVECGPGHSRERCWLDELLYKLDLFSRKI